MLETDLGQNSGSISHHLGIIEAMSFDLDTVQARPPSREMELVQAAKEYREAFSAVGIGITRFDLMTEGQIHLGGSKVAAGQYDSRSNELAIASVPVMLRVARAARKSVKEVTEETINHEIRHQQSMTSEGAKEVKAIIVELGGESAYHDGQEAMASFGTTENDDLYGGERSRAATDATEFGLSYTEYINVIYKGDVEALRASIAKKSEV